MQDPNGPMQVHWSNTHETGPDSGNCLVFLCLGNVSDLFVLGLSKRLNNVYANEIV